MKQDLKHTFTPMIKKIRLFSALFSLALALSLCLWNAPVYAQMPSYTSDEAVYAVETKTGSVITAQNAHKRMYPASTTKMMTSLVALDYVANKMDKKVTVGDEVNQVTADSSKADIRQGDRLTWRQLFYGLLLPSGNDAALTIACKVGRLASHDSNLDTDKAISKFVALMNQKAKALNLEDSHFVNPHGLHDENHYTTAADLENISQHALKNKTIRQIVKTEVYTCDLKSGKKKWINTNSLIINPNDLSQMTESSHDGKQYNQYATGVKTGHTDNAGRCLVFSSDNGKKRMIAVILHSDNQIFSQANAIINTLDDDYTRVNWTDKTGYYKTIALSHVHLFDSSKLEVYTKKQAASVVPRAEKSDYRVKLVLNKQLFGKRSNGKYRLTGDIEAGQKIGTLNITKSGQVVRRFALTSRTRVRERGFVDYLLIFILIVAIVLILLYIYAKKVSNERKRRQRRKRRLIKNQKNAPRKKQSGQRHETKRRN